MDISNTLLATSIFIFFLFPGFVFLRSFWASDKGTLTASNFYNYLLYSTFISTVIYLLALSAFNLFSLILWPLLDRYVGISLTKFATNIASKKVDFDALFVGIYKLLTCSFIAYFIGFFLGKYFRELIIRKNWDLKFPMLEFQNHWFYLLTVRKFLYNNSIVSNSYTVVVYILYQAGQSLILYKGEVKTFFLKDEELEHIVIDNVFRTSITQWEEIRLRSIGLHNPITFDLGLVTASCQFDKHKVSLDGKIQAINHKHDVLKEIDKINNEVPKYIIPNSLILKASDIRGLTISYVDRLS
ncbi:hypothetical protein [Flavobacterium sp.]|uniref:hypothetical protein n=1 Tax=Flavobacterium sp. TaxID=239 RepID=UPI0039E4EBDC